MFEKLTDETNLGRICDSNFGSSMFCRISFKLLRSTRFQRNKIRISGQSLKLHSEQLFTLLHSYE